MRAFKGSVAKRRLNKIDRFSESRTQN
jgi:hypothetical protein